MRRVLPSILVFVGTLLAFVAVLSIWVSRQVLETDQWTNTSAKMLQQPAIQSALANYLVDQLYANVDISGELKAALPPRAQALAGPVASALRPALTTGAKEALQRPKVQQAWQAANRVTQKQLVDFIEGKTSVINAHHGAVTLDLKALLLYLQRSAGIGGRLASVLPASAAQITILRSNQLSTVQTIAKLLKPIAALMIVLMVVCYGVAIALAQGRRRTFLRAAGFGLIFAGVAALVVRRFGGQEITKALAPSQATRPAAEAAWTVGTQYLVDVATATILYGAVVVAGTWLAGPSRYALRLRGWLAPFLRDPWRAWAGFAGLVLLLLLWAPTEGLRRVWPALALIALMAVGYEALRRRTAQDFPAPGARVPPSDDGAGAEHQVLSRT
jgi:hypothetical protein